METKEMKIVAPKGYEIDRENSTLDCIRFKPKSKFPMTWDEAYDSNEKYDYIDERGNVQSVSVQEYISDDDRFFIPSGMGTSMLALCQLLVLRNAWWMADGNWRPDWKDGKKKHYISQYMGSVDIDSATYANIILVFRTPEIRDKFYEAFKGLIEEAKELL